MRSDARPAGLWRTVLKSRMLRAAVAAAIVLAVVLAATDGWMRITAPAFGLEDISNAMKEVEYAHFILKVEESNLDPQTAKQMHLGGWESWTSRHPPRQISKHDDGKIYCTEQDTGKVSRYDPESNVIVIEQRSPFSWEELSMSEFDRLTRDLANLEKDGAKIEYGKGTYLGRPVTVVRVDHNPPGHLHSIISMMVDPDTYLLRKMTWEQTDPEKGWRALASGVADYPDSVPMDIYEAGASRSAKVLVADAAQAGERDTRPLDAIKRHDAARERLPKQWTLVAVETGEDDIIHNVLIVYVDNQKERWESRAQAYWQTKVSADTIPVSQGLLAIRKWAHAQEYLRLVTSLYDGRYKYAASFYDGVWHKENKTELKPSWGFSSGGLSLLGWAGVSGKSVESSYAAQHGLICIEAHDTANVQHGRLMEPAQRRLYYLDPSRDYMCVRGETYRHVMRPDQLQPKISEVEFNPYSTPSEPTSVREVMEYGRIETGQTYPVRLREVSTTWSNRNGQWELGLKTTRSRIHIQPASEFPEGICDPNNFPEWTAH